MEYITHTQTPHAQAHEPPPSRRLPLALAPLPLLALILLQCTAPFRRPRCRPGAPRGRRVMLRLRCVPVSLCDGYLTLVSSVRKKSEPSNCSSPGATATGEFVAGNGKVLFLGSSEWIFAAFGRKGNGFICWSRRVGLARFESSFGSLFLFLFLWTKPAYRQAKLGLALLVQTPGVYLSRLGFFLA